MKSDVEWLLRTAAFNESENDKLRSIRIDLERDLNEIRVKLQELRESTSFKEISDSLNGKLLLVSSASTSERIQAIRIQVDTLRFQVNKALEEQRKADGMSGPLAATENKEGSDLNRAETSQHIISKRPSTHEEDQASEEDDANLPCEIGSSFVVPTDMYSLFVICQS